MVRSSRKLPAIPANCRECPIRGLTVCQPLEGDHLEIVQRFKLGDRVLRAGSQLYRPGETCTELYNVLDGWVSLYHVLRSGHCQILDFAVPGYFLGYQPDLDAPMQHGAECITDVAVCVFPRQRFAALIEKNPSLAIRLAWLNARDTVIAHEHLTNVGCRPARARMAQLLLELCFRCQRPVSKDQGYEIPITQHHIADALGLTSVYVSQMLKLLREQRLLVFKNGLLRILDPDGLAEIADIDHLFLD